MSATGSSAVKSDQEYLLDIREAVHRVFQYTRAGKEAFMTRALVQEAVLRNLEIVGEAVKKLPDAPKSAYPGVAWKRIAEMRDKTIHEHFVGNLELVWEAVESDLRGLEKAVDLLLKGGEVARTQSQG